MNTEKIDNFRKYNNYINKKVDYTSLVSTVNLSIDFTKLFLRYDLISSHDFLRLANSIFDNVVKISNNFRHFNANKVIDGVSYDFRFSFIFIDNYFLGTSLRIGHPDKKVVDFIENSIPSGYSISAVEYSVDIHGNDPCELYRLMRVTGHIKWPGKHIPSSYSTTYYLSNSRTSVTSGAYIYIKFDAPDSPFVRVELRARNRFFYNKRITKLKTALSLSPSEVFKRLSFSYVDLRELLSKTKSSLGYKNDDNEFNIVLDEFMVKIMNIAVFDDLESDSSIAGMTRVKQKVNLITGASSLILKTHDFEDIFFGSIKNKRFI